jgi:hypothetical protein
MGGNRASEGYGGRTLASDRGNEHFGQWDAFLARSNSGPIFHSQVELDIPFQPQPWLYRWMEGRIPCRSRT